MSVDYQERLHDRLPALPESIAPLRHSVLGFASDSGASERQREDIALAVSEALSNAVVHAYVGHGWVALARRVSQFLGSGTARGASCDKSPRAHIPSSKSGGQPQSVRASRWNARRERGRDQLSMR